MMRIIATVRFSGSLQSNKKCHSSPAIHAWLKHGHEEEEAERKEGLEGGRRAAKAASSTQLKIYIRELQASQNLEVKPLSAESTRSRIRRYVTSSWRLGIKSIFFTVQKVLITRCCAP